MVQVYTYSRGICFTCTCTRSSVHVHVCTGTSIYVRVVEGAMPGNWTQPAELPW